MVKCLSQDIRSELGILGKDYLLDVMIRNVHRKLRAEYGIPDDVSASVMPTGTHHPTTHVQRAALYALQHGITSKTDVHTHSM